MSDFDVIIIAPLVQNSWIFKQENKQSNIFETKFATWKC